MRANRQERLRQSLAPPDDQWALLVAAFAPEEEFDAAFRAWRAAIGAHPTPESASLLPLLVPRLEGQGTDDPVVAYCRQAYRLAWAKNALMTRRLPDMLAPFGAASITPILLKGLALQAHYRGNRLRAFGDLDVLVPPEAAREAIRSLQDRGWRSPTFSNPRGFDPRFAHAIEWHNQAGDIIDLHVHPMHHWITWKEAGRLFAEGAIRFAIGEKEALTLRREHHLLQTIVNALAAPQPHGRWMADCIALIESGPTDWDMLVADAERLRVAPLAGAALDLLAGLLPGLPETPRHRLLAAEADPGLFAFDRALYDRTWRARLHGHWRTLRVGAGDSLADAIRLLPAYARFCRSRRGWMVR